MRSTASPVRKLTDYLGVLRTVVFCTEDLQLVKGRGPRAPALPRFAPFADAARLPAAVAALHARRCAPATPCSGNRAPDEAALDSFSHELVKLGEEIIRRRRELVPNFRRSRDWRIAAFPTMPRNCASNISRV